MNNIEKIYDLILSCDKTNIKLAYELFKSINDFDFEGLTNYVVFKDNINYTSIHTSVLQNFYGKLKESLKNSLKINFNAEDALDYYNDKLKHLFVSVTSVCNNLREDEVGLKCRLYDEKYENIITKFEMEYNKFNDKWKYCKFTLYLNDSLIFLHDLEAYIKNLNKTKNVIEQIEGMNLINDYCNLKKKEKEEINNYSEFVENIYCSLKVKAINNRVIYNKVLDALNTQTYPIDFNDNFNKVTIHSYDQKKDKIGYTIDEFKTIKYCDLNTLISKILISIIK